MTLALLALLLPQPAAAAGDETITICHATGSDTTPYTEITISTSAWEKGTGHGGHSDDAEEFVWYLDEDGDGYGSDDDTVVSCTPPSGYVALGGDCDDADAALSPGSYELCDDMDNDCDGEVDEGALITAEEDDLIRYDLSDGVSTTLFASPGWSTVMSAVASNIDSDVIYGVSSKGAIYRYSGGTSSSIVYEADFQDVCGAAVGPDGALYYISRDANALMRLDQDAGEAAAVGTIEATVGLCGLTWSPEDGVFYMLNGRTILALDPDDASTLESVKISGMTGGAAGIAWSCAENALYTVSLGGLYEADLDTGTATQVHTTGSGALSFTAD